MERLTKRNEADTAYYYPKCFEKCDGFGASEKCNNCVLVHDVCEKLGEYEDLEEQGLLLKLPCKIGTNKLYYIDDDKEIYRINGDEVSIKRFPNGQIIYDYDCCEFSYDDFGKTVFLTKEEAEEKLKELNINERN